MFTRTRILVFFHLAAFFLGCLFLWLPYFDLNASAALGNEQTTKALELQFSASLLASTGLFLLLGLNFFIRSRRKK